tara:strand:+ start:65 stop:208 length:144 start_codon:yes stop_codon:yes gene_type:complete
VILKFNQSIKFLIIEYHRLIKKSKENTISKNEKETLSKLKIFLGKKK